MSRSCFWDCYGERVRQLLAKFFLFSFLFVSFFLIQVNGPRSLYKKLTRPSFQWRTVCCQVPTRLLSYATARHEKEDGKTLVYDKRDRPITCEFCRDLHLPLIFSRLLQKGLFKERWSLAKSHLKQNYCHACHTRFAVFFPLPSCCASSLLTEGQWHTLDLKRSRQCNSTKTYITCINKKTLEWWKRNLLS